MSKHTPGPWRIEDKHRARHDDVNGGEFIPVMAEAGWVADVRVGGGQQFANARLIAAAPELLEALRPFANYACEPPCGCHNCAARAAVAKAEEAV